MLNSFDDIRSRITEPPTWFDCNGVPRYGDFHPTLSPNIYADQVLLYEIACQACNARFLVEENWSSMDFNCIAHGRPNPTLQDRVVNVDIHFGDPPCWDCAGATMNCIDIKTVQFWDRENEDREWERQPNMEGLSLD